VAAFGMSLLASNISAEHVVGLAGDGYRVGMVTGGFEWMAAWCLMILAPMFVPLYLRSRIYSIPEFLERRCGWGLRAFLSGNLLVMNVLTKNAIDLWAGSLLLVLLFGWNQLAVMTGLSIFTALYTMKGACAPWFTRTWFRARGSSSAALSSPSCGSRSPSNGEATRFRTSHHRLPLVSSPEPSIRTFQRPAWPIRVWSLICFPSGFVGWCWPDSSPS
jgi:hypothetical protein